MAALILSLSSPALDNKTFTTINRGTHCGLRPNAGFVWGCGDVQHKPTAAELLQLPLTEMTTDPLTLLLYDRCVSQITRLAFLSAAIDYKVFQQWSMLYCAFNKKMFEHVRIIYQTYFILISRHLHNHEHISVCN